MQCQHIKVGVAGHRILKGEKIAFFKIINNKKVTENDQRNCQRYRNYYIWLYILIVGCKLFFGGVE